MSFTKKNILSLSADNSPGVGVSYDLGKDVGDSGRSVQVRRSLSVGLVLWLSDDIFITSTRDFLSCQLNINILEAILLLITLLLGVRLKRGWFLNLEFHCIVDWLWLLLNWFLGFFAMIFIVNASLQQQSRD